MQSRLGARSERRKQAPAQLFPPPPMAGKFLLPSHESHYKQLVHQLDLAVYLLLTRDLAVYLHWHAKFEALDQAAANLKDQQNQVI